MPANLSCPRCAELFVASLMCGTVVWQCPRCLSNWLDTATFYSLGTDAQRRRDPMRSATPTGDGYMSVSRLKCAQCGRVMRRFNYAAGSGVHLDFCKEHGVWLDRGELERMLEFIRLGPPSVIEYERPGSLLPPRSAES